MITIIIAYAKPFEYTEHLERGITYWNWTLQPVKEADGNISGLVFSLVNVTEQEKAIIAQHESDERFRILVEQASDGIFIADPQGNYVDVNPSGCKMLGFTQDEILKLNMQDLVDSDEQKKTPVRFAELRSGNDTLSERMLVTKSGDLLPVEISGKALDNGNLIGIVRNITERKQFEREREAVIAVSTALRQATTRTEILNKVLDHLEDLFQADGVVLVLPDPQTKGFIDEMGRGTIGKRMTGLNVPPGDGVCNWVIENKKPYLTNHADRDPLFYRPELLGDSHCLASVPLIAQEQAIGALWIARQENILEQDVRLLNAIADIAANALHRVMLYDQAKQQLNHLIALHEIDIAISTNLDLDKTLNVILSHVQRELKVDAASILLLDAETQTLDFAAGIGFRTRNIEEASIELGKGCAGRAAQEHHTISCPDLKHAHQLFDCFLPLEDEEFMACYATPIIVKGEIRGVLELFHRSPLETRSDWLAYFETLATQAAIAIESTTLFENLQQSNKELILAYDATIEGWSHALDLRDRETKGHTQRVADTALRIAEKMGMSDEEKQHLRWGALLHDIGKMGIPDSILHKPGPLSADEWKIMRQHPAYAYKMLSAITYLHRALDVPHCHHEKWDGSGYPRGLKREEIPLFARVFAIADVFDALTSDRPYRDAWSREEAYRYIQEQSGKYFDPQIVRIFIENAESIVGDKAPR